MNNNFKTKRREDLEPEMLSDGDDYKLKIENSPDNKSPNEINEPDFNKINLRISIGNHFRSKSK